MPNSSDKSGHVVSQEVNHSIGTCIESIRHLKDFKRDKGSVFVFTLHKCSNSKGFVSSLTKSSFLKFFSHTDA